MSSGSQIGGVVGAVIGGWVTGWVNPQGYQYGYAIGSAIGGYVDPTRTYGPRLEDASAQTSTVGGSIPFGYGAFTCAGNIIWADRLVEHKKTERVGKGGSEKQTTYTYTRSYAIGVCEGPITNFVWIKKNGKLVYASDPAGLAAAMGWTGQMVSDLVASSNEWLQSTTLYRGTDTQMPDSTIVAVEGVGNVSPFRDLAYIVKENEDLTDMQGAVSQYEFCVFRGAAKSYTTPPYPIEYTENLGVSTQLVGMTLRDIYQSADEIEHLSVTPSLTGMTLRLVIQSIDAPTEHLATSASLQGMTLRLAMQSFDAPTEHLAPTASLQGMTLRAARIDADPGTEHLSVSPSLQGMSLYEP